MSFNIDLSHSLLSLKHLISGLKDQISSANNSNVKDEDWLEAWHTTLQKIDEKIRALVQTPDLTEDEKSSLMEMLKTDLTRSLTHLVTSVRLTNPNVTSATICSEIEQLAQKVQTIYSAVQIRSKQKQPAPEISIANQRGGFSWEKEIAQGAAQARKMLSEGVEWSQIPYELRDYLHLSLNSDKKGAGLRDLCDSFPLTTILFYLALCEVHCKTFGEKLCQALGDTTTDLLLTRENILKVLFLYAGQLGIAKVQECVVEVFISTCKVEQHREVLNEAFNISTAEAIKKISQTFPPKDMELIALITSFEFGRAMGCLADQKPTIIERILLEDPSLNDQQKECAKYLNQMLGMIPITQQHCDALMQAINNNGGLNEILGLQGLVWGREKKDSELIKNIKYTLIQKSWYYCKLFFELAIKIGNYELVKHILRQSVEENILKYPYLTIEPDGSGSSLSFLRQLYLSNSITKQGWEVLIQAMCQCLDTDTTKLLPRLFEHSYLLFSVRFYNTTLKLAVEAKNYELVELLLGFLENVTGEFYNYVGNCNDPKIFDLLVNNDKTNEHISFLFHAAKNNKNDVFIDTILNKCSAEKRRFFFSRALQHKDGPLCKRIAESPNFHEGIHQQLGSDFTDEDLKFLCSLGIPIKSLSLSYCAEITDEGLKFLPSTLEKLEIENCSKITVTGIQFLTQLEELSLCNVMITDEELKCLPQQLRCLKIEDVLRAVDCNIERPLLRITDGGLQFLPQTLKSFEINGSGEITPAGLKSLPKSVTHLYLTGCPKVLELASPVNKLQELKLRYYSCISIDSIKAFIREFEGGEISIEVEQKFITEELYDDLKSLMSAIPGGRIYSTPGSVIICRKNTSFS